MVIGEEVKLAMISVLGLVLVALINGVFLSRRRGIELGKSAKIVDLHAALKESHKEVSIDIFMMEYDQALKQLDGIAECNGNAIDRILLFKAINGKHTPTETTCFHEKRVGKQRHFPYVNYPINDDYVNMLRDTYTIPSLHVVSSKLKKGQTKDIYAMEGVIESLWIHLVTKEKGEQAEIYYMSLSTHQKEGIAQNTVTECELAAATLRNFMGRF